MIRALLVCLLLASLVFAEPYFDNLVPLRISTTPDQIVRVTLPIGEIMVVGFDGDLNLDGRCDIFDFVILQMNFGQPGEWDDGDLNRDGTVNIFDWVVFQANYGKTYTARFCALTLPKMGQVGDINWAAGTFLYYPPHSTIPDQPIYGVDTMLVQYTVPGLNDWQFLSIIVYAE